MSRRFKVETIFSAIDRMTAPLTRMQSRVSRFSRVTRDRLMRVQRATGRLSSAMFTMGRRGAVALTALVGAAVLSLNMYTNSIDEMAKRSDRLDFNVEHLAQWQFVAEQRGLSAQQFDSALEGLNTRLGQARIGAGSLYGYLRRTDRDTLRQIQRASDLSEAFEFVISAIERQENAQARAALTTAAFGRSNLRMTNLAAAGADEIARLRAEVERMRPVTQQGAVDAQRFNDAQNRLRRELIATRNRAIEPLLPVLAENVERIGDLIAANQDLIDQNINRYLMYIIDNFMTIVTWIGKLIASIAGLWAFNLALKAIIGTLTLINLLMGMNPIVLVIAAAATAVGGLVWQLSRWKRQLEEIRGPLTWARYLWEDMERIARRFFGINAGRFAAGIRALVDATARVFDVITNRIDRILRSTRDLLRQLGLIDTGDTDERAELRDAARQQAERGAVNRPPLTTSSERISRQFMERVEREQNELIIRDETGRAELRNERPRQGLQIIRTGGV